MKFRVIQGGLAEEAPSRREIDSTPNADDVRREAERRIAETGYERWRNRAVVTGAPIPREIQYLVMQIGYVAEAISRLARIPADYRSDAYWPMAYSTWIEARAPAG